MTGGAESAAPAQASRWDTVILGCGMAGLAAGIRLAMFGQRVLIVERHNAPGGLNSFYSFDGRKYDVGLHAVTNYVPAGVKGTPLGKLLRQLRLDREQLQLRPQQVSRIAFPGADLRFANDFALLESEVERVFPAQADRFAALARAVQETDETALDAAAGSARARLRDLGLDPLLAEMLLCPLFYYGSAREDDLDWPQFCILFKALFREGFARPPEGVRTILRALLDRYRASGGQRRMKCGVARLVAQEGRIERAVLDDGTEVAARNWVTTIGWPETLALLAPPPPAAGGAAELVGRLSFVEAITVTQAPPAAFGWDETIVFFNDSATLAYRRPEGLVDPRSGVICFPNNYAYAPGEGPAEGFWRLTALASHPRWKALDEAAYRAAKAEWFPRLQEVAAGFLPAPAGGLAAVRADTVATDMFTPATIERYTGRLGGAVYGAPDKLRDGRTPWANLFVAGTDQGFLGIVGAMLSGISMANAWCLR